MKKSGEKGMSVIVKTVSRLTLGFILLYGIYIALNGHRATGGAFAGGVIAALSFIHIMLAFGKEVALRKLHSHVMRMTISGAAIVFLVISAAVFAGMKIHAETLIPVSETLVVSGGLFAIFVALVLLSKTDRDAE
ncbi:MAG TPA: MnhB domain-containing protein [Candidatus Omnitrophota bacterium]|mgnify:CR=1 FL=1|nr:MnhB domain-containing protein [Candidatus Omnitrophota bacterium]